jgi:hypothetical protein
VKTKRTCFICDELIEGPWLFRIRIGGTIYDNQEMLFVQDPIDQFQDSTKVKWLCGQCAENAGLQIDNLEIETCRAPEGIHGCCDRTFQPVE